MHILRLSRPIGITTAAFMIGAMTCGTVRAASETVGVESRNVVASNPKPHEVVNGSMVQVSVCFDVPVDHGGSVLTLRGREGEHQLRPRLESATNCLFSIVGQLSPGPYELAWKARLSSGRIQIGAIPFTVGSKLALR